MTPPPLVVVELKLDSDEDPRVEAQLVDFVLRDEVCRLLACLGELKNGLIDRIEVRAGIPRRVVFKASLGRDDDLIHCR